MFKYIGYFLSSLYIVLMIVAMAAGGHWPWAAFIAVLVSAHVMEKSLGDSSAEPQYRRTWTLNLALYLVFPLILALFAVFAWMVQGEGDWLGIGALAQSWFHYDLFQARLNTATGDLVGAAISIGYIIGLIATNVGHELTHRTHDKVAMLVGRWLLAMSCHTSFSIEHVYGHHLYVCTQRDPATARRGESIYAFIVRSIFMQSRNAWQIERERLARKGISVWSWRSRMPRGVAMSIVYFLLFYAAAGWRGVGFFMIASFVGRIVLEFSNYMQHYGLVRVPGTPVKLHHSWNSNTASNGYFLFNLTRHASHHVMPELRYWEARAYADALMMRMGYLTAGCLFMIPPLWNRLMVAPLQHWDEHYATAEERRLAAEANRQSGVVALMPTPKAAME